MVIEARNISLLGQNQKLTQIEKIGIWIHKHPTTTKIAKVAALILGGGLLASLPFTAPILGTGIVVSLAITGVLLTLASSVALFSLDIIIPPHHDMKNHVYKPGQCDGGRLYYEGDLPILSLDSDDPFRAGKAHGYLCGDAINRVSKRLGLVMHTLARQPRSDRLPNTLAGLRQVIPHEYFREMEGLVEGYNKWAQEQPWWQFPKKLTLDDVLLLHLIPDSLHFQAGAFERGLTEVSSGELAVACSAIVDRDPQNGFVFARNMDWPSFGLVGAYSLIINRKHTNGYQSTVEVGVPGFVGTLTGMNSQGLSLAMNVCSGNTQVMTGMPASLYNRACLERCRTIIDVESFIHNQLPLGAYHLTVTDRERAESIHFFQSHEDTHLIRPWEENRPLSTLNFRYNPQPNCPMHNDAERHQLLNEFFQHRGNRPLEDILALPFFNNWITTHRVVMEPQRGRFRVAFDNAFAGNAPLHEVPTQRLFQRPINAV
jgi:hypothetical protein